jgi:hypothetical protein
VIRPRNGVIRFAAIFISISAAVSTGQERAADAAGEIRALLAAGLFDQAETAARADLARVQAAFAADSVQVANARDNLVRALLANGAEQTNRRSRLRGWPSAAGKRTSDPTTSISHHRCST